jgi:hypothetical protein
LLIAHAGQRNDDVVALAGDFGLGHAKAVNATADDFLRLVDCF